MDQDFLDWLDDLNFIAAERSYAGADTLWQDTGADAWRDYYEAGLSAASALTEDELIGL